MLRRHFLLLFRVSIALALLLPIATHAQTPSTSRQNPAPFGETVTVGDYDIGVLSTTPDARDIVLDEDSFNNPPEAGQQFFMVRVELTYLGTNSGDPFWDLVYGAVGEEGIAYTDSGNSCGVYPDSPYGASQMFPGAVTEINVCWTIDDADADSLVMFVKELAAPDTTRVWLSLSDDEPATTTGADSVAGQSRSRLASSADPTPEVTRTSRGGSSTTSQSSTSVTGTSRGTPAPFGESVTIGDYEVRVISITPDAREIVMEENRFNDPPAPGHQFYMVRLELTYIGTESGDPFWDLVYGSVGTTGMGYTDSGNSCGVYPDSPHDISEMFPGAVTEMNICWTIDADDAGSLVMFVHELFSSDGERVWLSLEP